jgi:hypothetical protein
VNGGEEADPIEIDEDGTMGRGSMQMIAKHMAKKLGRK